LHRLKFICKLSAKSKISLNFCDCSKPKLKMLDEFKLKKGFKQVYKTSLYNLLLKYKMSIAKKLILKK